MEIRVPITYMVIAAMMLAMPELLQVATTTIDVTGPAVASGTVEGATNLGALTNNMQQSMSSVKDIISAISYIGGMGFGIKAALAFKQYAEQDSAPEIYTSTEKNIEIENPVQQPINVNLEKEVKIEKIEPIKDMFKKQSLYEYDFEDKELNELALKIQNEVKSLKDHKFLQKDMEALLMVENTEKEYLKSIHQSYIEIPLARRGTKEVKDSSYNLTFRQLTVLLQGLDDIENRIVQSNVMDQKANEIFLKQKIANM